MDSAGNPKSLRLFDMGVAYSFNVPYMDCNTFVDSWLCCCNWGHHTIFAYNLISIYTWRQIINIKGGVKWLWII